MSDLCSLVHPCASLSPNPSPRVICSPRNSSTLGKCGNYSPGANASTTVEWRTLSSLVRKGIWRGMC
uniref:MIP32961p1 n=1 Tax=Drosophila melanogaster TaxID=7227 RepID=G7H814_DROME|nr:MIP32961p1 [Drosophila melanogaster]